MLNYIYAIIQVLVAAKYISITTQTLHKNNDLGNLQLTVLSASPPLSMGQLDSCPSGPVVVQLPCLSTRGNNNSVVLNDAISTLSDN